MSPCCDIDAARFGWLQLYAGGLVNVAFFAVTLLEAEQTPCRSG